MHLSVNRQSTACGADRRGKRSTRALELVSCKHCTAAIARGILQRATTAATAVGLAQCSAPAKRQPWRAELEIAGISEDTLVRGEE